MNVFPGFSKNTLNELMPVVYFVDREAVVFLAENLTLNSFFFKLLFIIGVV